MVNDNCRVCREKLKGGVTYTFVRINLVRRFWDKPK